MGVLFKDPRCFQMKFNSPVNSDQLVIFHEFLIHELFFTLWRWVVVVLIRVQWKTGISCPRNLPSRIENQLSVGTFRFLKSFNKITLQKFPHRCCFLKEIFQHLNGIQRCMTIKKKPGALVAPPWTSSLASRYLMDSLPRSFIRNWVELNGALLDPERRLGPRRRSNCNEEQKSYSNLPLRSKFWCDGYQFSLLLQTTSLVKPLPVAPSHGSVPWVLFAFFLGYLKEGLGLDQVSGIQAKKFSLPKRY